MKFWLWVAGVGLTALVLLCGGVGFVIWQQEDFVARQWTLSAPPQGPHRAAFVSQFAPQGDSSHSIGVKSGKAWKKWASVITLGNGPGDKWQLIWSRDGSMVALKQGPNLLGDPKLKIALYTQAFDFVRGQNLASNQTPLASFSRRIEKLLKQRGGAVAGRETTRKLGVWRWQDRQFKDAF